MGLQSERIVGRKLPIILIVVTIAKFCLSAPVFSKPSLSEVPTNIDDMVDYYIDNTKLTYDYRTPAINAELEKIFHYIQEVKTENIEKFHNLESALKVFQTRIKKFTHNCGINDVLMILAPAVVREIFNAQDVDLIKVSDSFRDLVKMNEIQRQVQAVKEMEDFLDGKDSSVVIQFHSKYVAWEKDNCYGVSVWDE